MNRQPIFWSLVHAVLLLMFFSPFVILTFSFMMVPVVMLFVKSNLRKFVVYYILSLLMVYIVALALGAGSIGLVAAAISLFFLAPSVAMGILYKRKVPARNVLTGGAIALLGELLLLLVILALSGVQVMEEIRQFIRDSLETVPPDLRQMIPDELMEQVIQVMTQLLPLYLIGFSLFYSFVTHGVSRRLLIRSGEHVPGLKPVRQWMLPKSLIWYFLVALIASYVIPGTTDSILFMILLNLIPLLVIVFTVQSFAFLFFLADLKGWSRAVPVIAVILLVPFMILLPGLMHLFSLLGLLDVAFPIRDRLKKQ